MSFKVESQSILNEFYKNYSDYTRDYREPLVQLLRNLLPIIKVMNQLPIQPLVQSMHNAIHQFDTVNFKIEKFEYSLKNIPNLPQSVLQAINKINRLYIEYFQPSIVEVTQCSEPATQYIRLGKIIEKFNVSVQAATDLLNSIDIVNTYIDTY